MSTDHYERTYRALLRGEERSADQRRHAEGCDECQRAAADVRRFEERLREQSAVLALELLPDGILDVEAAVTQRPARWWIPVLASGGAAAAVAIAVGVALFATGQDDRVAAPVPASGTPSPEASAGPATHEPAPTDPPALPEWEKSYFIVEPGGMCADGIAGFSIRLPDGWSANRRFGDSPACRDIGPLRILPEQALVEGIVRVSVSPDEPVFAPPQIIESSEQRALPDGTPVERHVVTIPEQGALAGERFVEYVVPLLAAPDGTSGGYLLARADPVFPEAVTGLDEIIQTLERFSPLRTDAEAAAEAAVLFADPDYCDAGQHDLTVIYPDVWWTNTAIEDVPPCAWYAPERFEVEQTGEVPAGVLITATIVEGDHEAQGEVEAWESTIAGRRPATRWLLSGGAAPSGESYEYVVPLGEGPGIGPNLVVSARGEPGEPAYQLARAVLDEMMRQLSLAPPPPGAESENPPIDGSPVTGTDSQADFVLELTVDQERYRAGQPIFARATLTYLGGEPSATVYGSSHGNPGLAIRQLDGPINPGSGMTSDCGTHEFRAREPRAFGGKGGAYSQDDPLASFYEAFTEDPLLRLPPGRWEIAAFAQYYVGPGDCIGEELTLHAAVEVVVEP